MGVPVESQYRHSKRGGRCICWNTKKDLEKIFRAMDLDTQKKRDERSEFVYTKPAEGKNDEKWFYYLDISTKSENEEGVCQTGMK